MDECTNLQNFDVPVDTSLIIAVCAKDDAYVPRDDCVDLGTIWPGVEIRYVDAGHVSAYLFYQKMFRYVFDDEKLHFKHGFIKLQRNGNFLLFIISRMFKFQTEFPVFFRSSNTKVQ